jgi:hypothetical protein
MMDELQQLLAVGPGIVADLQRVKRQEHRQ